jgi:hypothetical protein
MTARTTERGALGSSERFPAFKAEFSVPNSSRDGMGKDSTVSAVASISPILAFIDPERMEGLLRASRGPHHAQRFCGRGVRWDVVRMSRCWIPGFEGGPRFVIGGVAEPLTLRKLKAVRLLLQRRLASIASRVETRKILLHEDNQCVVNILIVMVYASRPIMAELRRMCWKRQ